MRQEYYFGNKIRAIVCGGDGTVMWVIEELVKGQIDISLCPIGIVPFGTGNDFSRILGWGPTAPPSLIGNQLQDLKQMAKQWSNAKVQDFDIWEVIVRVKSNGRFVKIVKHDQGFNKVVVTEQDQQGQEKQLNQVRKKMCNYFSFGVDSRIGFGFDKSRTTSVSGNKCVYCWEGFKKMFLKTSKINDIVESFYECEEEDKLQVKRLVFGQIGKSPYTPILKGNPVSILCLNINSYSAGITDVWRANRKNLGIHLGASKDNQFAITNAGFQEQSFGDGKLEFLSFNSISGLANERFIHGWANRVEQGSGPYIIKFKQSQLPVITYFQIDGEFFQVINPDYVEIRQTNFLKSGKIKVLVKQS